MNSRKLVTSTGLLGLAITLAIVATAQQPARSSDTFKLKNIRQQQVDAPAFSANGADLGGRPSTLWRKWLKIEVQFESDPDWADDVQLKYYVLVGEGRDTRLFVGDVNHINVAKGTQHFSAMFIQPNTLHRYGAGTIKSVAVQLFHQNRLISQLSEPVSKDRWWEQYTPVPGYLLAPQDTPWAPIAHERFEAVKPSTR